MFEEDHNSFTCHDRHLAILLIKDTLSNLLPYGYQQVGSRYLAMSILQPLRHSVSMVRSTGIEPVVLIFCCKHSKFWCPWRDSNPQHLRSKRSDSTRLAYMGSNSILYMKDTPVLIHQT